jgi:hypothetical protein
MLINASHVKNSLLLVFFVTIIVVGFFLGIKNYLIGPSGNANDRNSQVLQEKTDLLIPTDKSELGTEVLIDPPQVPSEVVAAEAQLPVATAPAYRDACKELKTMYTTERDENVNKENIAFKSNQQAIVNKFSKDGMSFSSAQKLAQTKELKRHNAMLEQIEKLYQKQVKTVSC